MPLHTGSKHSPHQDADEAKHFLYPMLPRYTRRGHGTLGTHEPRMEDSLHAFVRFKAHCKIQKTCVVHVGIAMWQVLKHRRCIGIAARGTLEGNTHGYDARSHECDQSQRTECVNRGPLDYHYWARLATFTVNPRGETVRSNVHGTLPSVPANVLIVHGDVHGMNGVSRGSSGFYVDLGGVLVPPLMHTWSEDGGEEDGLQCWACMGGRPIVHRIVSAS